MHTDKRTYTYAWTCIHTYISIYRRTYVRTMHTYTDMHTYIGTHIHMNEYIQVSKGDNI